MPVTALFRGLDAEREAVVTSAGHGEARYDMHAGGSLTFDGEGPHGPVELVELPVRFLSVTGYGHVV